MTTTSVKIDKYTIQHEDGANVRVLRNNLPWLESDMLVGQKVLIAVADEIEALRSVVNFTVLEPASNEIAFTVDAGEFPVHYSMSSETAAAELQKLYQEWPGGLDEIKSALHTATAQTVCRTLNEASRDAAVDTLVEMGYTYFGKEEWKPPAAQLTNGIFCDIFRNGCKEYSHEKKSSADNKEWKADLKYSNEIVSTMAARRSATPCQPLTRSQVQKIVMDVCDTIYPQDNVSYSEVDQVFYGAFVHAIEVAHNIRHAPHSKENK